MAKNNRNKYNIDDYFIHNATGNVWKIIKIFESEYIRKKPEYHLECVHDRYNCIDYPYIPAMESNLDQFYTLSPSAKVLYSGQKLKQRTIGFVDYLGDMSYKTNYTQAEIYAVLAQELLNKKKL